MFAASCAARHSFRSRANRPTGSKRIMRAVRNERIDIDWLDRTLRQLEGLVSSGDESNLAETLVQIVNAPGKDHIRIG